MAARAVIPVPSDHETLDTFQRFLAISKGMQSPHFVHLNVSYEAAVLALSLLVDFHRIEVTVAGRNHACWQFGQNRFLDLQQRPKGCDLFILHGDLTAHVLKLEGVCRDGFRTQSERRRESDRAEAQSWQRQ
jgi:hypothetical protein